MSFANSVAEVSSDQTTTASSLASMPRTAVV